MQGIVKKKLQTEHHHRGYRVTGFGNPTNNSATTAYASFYTC